jgi:hypothetical protein
VFIFIGGLFVLNLFQSIVISTYLNEKEKLSNNHLLTEMQVEWLKAQSKCYKSRPVVNLYELKNPIRRIVIKITLSKVFIYFIHLCIVLNTLVLACNWVGIQQSIVNKLMLVNNIFTGIFTVEAILNMIVYGKMYFKKKWFILDIIILISAYAQIFNENLVSGYEKSMNATVIRALRFIRTLRLVEVATAIKNIAKSLISTIPNLANIALLLFLLITFYAIMGMNAFGSVMLHNALTDHANFQNF